ncbi:hypothetical protein [Hymenobacter yonginensis]|uniref:HTH cro/C1-type domain-containing protein n=1 Tax=Hymenobacter yonginensis TaxID=748197 RepID=A0ABY7PTN9_9BACT|nr:hypothetical protein [Hymenobacter yonginensis]WBO86276.1 hypothetical protein O9Z63_08435 [Hymenobacter yonginensis]
MSQETVSQRLSTLIKTLGLNPRSFSEKYGVNEGTTRGYTTRGSVPNADYIGTLLNSIEHLNPAWLLLGKGEMFLTGAPEVQVLDVKRPEDATAQEQQVKALQREVERLESQLRDKERIIQLLEMQLSK